MKWKTGRITALFVLMIFLLTVASSSIIVVATPVDREPFEVIMETSGPGEYKRMWTDGSGITHVRGMVGIIFNIKETVSDIIIGTGTFTYDMDFDPLSGNGRVSMLAKITLYDENYMMRASGEITDWVIQLRFVIVGREGCIKGTASGIMQVNPLWLSGTWIR